MSGTQSPRVAEGADQHHRESDEEFTHEQYSLPGPMRDDGKDSGGPFARSHSDMTALRIEWEILYSVIEGVRGYVSQQDGSPGAEELCGALTTATTRMRESLNRLGLMMVVAYLTSSMVTMLAG